MELVWHLGLFSLLLFQISGVCSSPQTHEASVYLQNVLNTGPLTTGTVAEKSDEYLQNYLKDQYHALKEQIKIGAVPNADQKFDSIQICINEGNSTGDPTLFKFKINPAPADPSLILSATLRMYLPPTIKNTHDTVFQVVKGQPLETPDLHRLLSTQFISGQPDRKGQWIEFNVMPAVKDWLQGEKPNLGILLAGLEKFNLAFYYYNPILSVKFDSFQNDYGTTPRFEIYGPQNESFVQTDETVSQPLSFCKRQELWIDFQKLGLLQPQNQDIGFCSGPCGKNDLRFGGAEHTSLMAMLSENNSNILGPACVPAEYGQVAIMYKQINGNYVVKRISRMTVKKCSCR